ncbi:hypothetical protein [Actinosynnema sp. NPDC020468]|uniref:hypothetical protein n=1 Tax=Actinosynnema sp. NPDC020468 TaxID=3154488 RepID=UPI00340DDA6A
MVELFNAFPAIGWAVLGTLAALAVKFVPGFAGMDVGVVADFLAAALTAGTGVVVHRLVTPVEADARGM